MKNIKSILMMVMIVCMMLSATSVVAFAEESAEGMNIEAILGELGVDFSSIEQELAALTAEAKGYIDGIVNMIMEDETYRSIATAVLAILAVLLFPVIIALIFIAYVTIAMMIIFAGALTAVVELLVGIVSQFIVL